MKRERGTSLDIVCVTNRHLCEGDFFERIEKIAASGVNAVILREKDLSESEYYCLAERFTGICKKYEIEAILHTYVNTAVRMKVRSIHLPLNVFCGLDSGVKNFFNRIGVSCHSVSDALEAEKNGASYITFGHVFATDCKKNLEPKGPEVLKEVCGAVKIPVYAIGGIDNDNISSVLDSGASGACIMSGFMRCNDPKDFVVNLFRDCKNG